MTPLEHHGRIAIRRAILDDAAPLAATAARIFRETFGPDSDPGQLALHLERSFTPRIQAREISDTDVTTLVAVSDAAAIAAFAQLRTGEAPPVVAGPAPIQLWRFYVDPAWHGRGLAQRLMQAVFEAAAGRGAQSLWLTVWEHNPRARAFYAKCGFTDVGTCAYLFGTEPQTDRVMARAVTGP